MPIWSDILSELGRTQQKGRTDFDRVRRKYLLKMQQHSKRNTILYASGWLQKESPPAPVSISDEDIQGFMEVSHGLSGDKLDLLLHSPGGSPEVAEAIVSYLRPRFSHIRVIVPQLAMSAATMISCAADEIVLGKHSFLGPTDPQIVLNTALGTRLVPAQSVLDQFDRAQRECTNPAKLSTWLPMLNQYGPDLLVLCESALDMSRELVRTWLETYMFKELEDRSDRAKSVSEWLANHKNFKSHNRHLPRADIENHGLTVTRLEEDEQLEDFCLSVFHATTHTFAGTSAIKIIENHAGRAFVKHLAIPARPPKLEIQGSVRPGNLNKPARAHKSGSRKR